MGTQVFMYQEQPITFSRDEEVMVNATEMAKVFNKKPTHFLENSQTKAFMSVLSGRVKNSELVNVLHGNNGGTWMHQKLALKFAAWLSPGFELWVYDRIEELLTTGKVHLQPKSKEEIIAEGYQLVLEEARIYKEKALLLEGTVQKQAPMVAYYNEVINSDNGHTATAIAQDFNLAAVSFNKKLQAWGIIRRVGGEWLLTAKYLDKGYAFTKKVPYLNTQNEQKTTNQLVWTEKGREFLHHLFKEKLAS